MPFDPSKNEVIDQWLPEGRQAAVCFTIDDVHPGRSVDHYDGGGDLGAGALGRVERLLERHEQLAVTLFTTPDWREISPSPTRRIASRIPLLRERVYVSRVLSPGERRLDRHPEFVAYLASLPRTEVALHGLHHIHRGPLLHVEFQDQSADECVAMLEESLRTFHAAGLASARGLCPPGWNAPDALVEAMDRVGLGYLASARDIVTPVSSDAEATMSGRRDVSLIHPTRLGATDVAHFTSNFQATSTVERAHKVIAAGGVLTVKAHIIKDAAGHIAIDGIDGLYCNYLDLLFAHLDERYGDRLWWTTMGEMSERIRAVGQTAASTPES